MGETEFNQGWEDEGAEYSPKSEFSKPKVVEEATNKCFGLRAKEMRTGYYNTKFTKEGLPLKVWIEDSRKAYCSAVIALRNLLHPEILADKDKYKEVDLKKIFDEYCYTELILEVVNGKNTYIKGERKYMPEMDESVYIRKIYREGNEDLILMPARWNEYVKRYWDEMVVQCDEMFRELMSVVHRLNYFKQQIRYG